MAKGAERKLLAQKLLKEDTTITNESMANETPGHHTEPPRMCMSSSQPPMCNFLVCKRNVAFATASLALWWTCTATLRCRPCSSLQLHPYADFQGACSREHLFLDVQDGPLGKPGGTLRGEPFLVSRGGGPPWGGFRYPQGRAAGTHRAANKTRLFLLLLQPGVMILTRLASGLTCADEDIHHLCWLVVDAGRRSPSSRSLLASIISNHVLPFLARPRVGQSVSPCSR